MYQPCAADALDGDILQLFPREIAVIQRTIGVSGLR
jgi:hypothetical protein